MGLFIRHRSHQVRDLACLLLLMAAALLTGCAKPYLDPATKEIPRAEFKPIDQPKPAHLIFEFQTKGAPNSRATRALLDQVTQEVKESGLFASVDASMSPEVAILNITLNNVAIAGSEDAAAKGFVTGFTFGLVGSSVSDGYICTISYLAPGRPAPIVKTARHAIHTTLGNASPPPGAIPMADVREAVHKMTKQILSNALRDLSQDPQF
jgi:hypothetical protein